MVSKKKVKTVEEVLEAAIVAEEKQPYKLPEGWEWVKLGALLDSLQYGYTESATHEKIGPHFLRITDLDDEINWDDVPYCSISEENFLKYKLNHNDLVVARMGSVGKSQIIKTPEDSVFASYLIRLVPNNLLLADYLSLFMKTSLYWMQIEQNSKGTTRANVNTQGLKNLIVPLSPITEQKDIIIKSNNFLAKIKHAEKLIEEAKETFELRRASFLEQVFKFEYHCLYQKDVNNIKTNEIFDFVTSGSRGWAKYYSDSGDIFIRVGNLKHDSISLQLDEIQYVSLPENVEGKRTEVQAGDILVSITADIGRIAVIDEGVQKSYINQHIALARPHKHFYSPYIGWYLAAKTCGNQQMVELQRGATKVGLGLNDIKNITIPVPTYEQQKEIAEFIEKKLKEFSKSEWFLEACLKQCNELKKSILQKAFKGELSTSNPNGEPAIDHLKLILQEKL
ncbi:hypothetical protein CBR59_17050 [Bacillus thuringiensis]|uniref:restriction endonuclease subunit S n=1 Tax=Bacillus thuringiensis TaxID=1428 RepID=UPI000C9E9578|nr:restriction endonuclease subunit S [Bacillus thuringiensis]MDA2274052.1 restriction endonuclease subunit S [Bacillus cereus]PNK27041.1 hypothetical protein CBP87_20045 [Bacillus thuringiensis]PNK54491.1 hypothetical protein CBR59_17050 [Bacillus thuringiensis]